MKKCAVFFSSIVLGILFFLLVLFCIFCCVCVYCCLKKREKLKNFQKKFFKDSDEEISDITNRLGQLEITTSNLMHVQQLQTTQQPNPFSLQDSPQPSASASASTNPFKSLLDKFSPWKESTTSPKLRHVDLHKGEQDDESIEIFSSM